MPRATRASVPLSCVSGAVGAAAPPPDVSLAWRADSGLMAGNFAGLGKAYGRCRAAHHNNRGLHAQSSDRIPAPLKTQASFSAGRRPGCAECADRRLLRLLAL